jgi:hypothetical protein
MNETPRTGPRIVYPWPADLGPMPVEDDQGRLTYVGCWPLGAG